MPGFLDGVRVLELGDYIAAPFAARLLADLGADVIKVEPTRGDSARGAGPFPGDAPHPEKSGLFLALNHSKRGLALDPRTEDGRTRLLALAGEADVLIENLGPEALDHAGLGAERLRSVNPRLVRASISPFGLSGPYRARAASDLVLFHMSGYASLVSGNVADPEAQPPLRAGGNQAEFVAGVTGAAAAVMGLALRDRTGAGCDLDVSAWEAMCMMPQGAIADAAMGRPARSRQGSGLSGSAIVSILPTRDGYIAISPREDHQWAAWLDIMGGPAWSQEERFATRAARQSNWAQLEPLLRAWTLTQAKQDLYRRCQEAHVPAFPVNTAADLFSSEQLRFRDFFQTLDRPIAGPLPYAGRPFKTGVEMPIMRPAPLLDADAGARFDPPAMRAAAPTPPVNGSRLPLRGYRVLDLSWIIAGPTCTRVLALMGAEVIKVESRRRPDPSRSGANFALLNQSKLSLSLNLSTERGLDIAKRLVAQCDAVIENYATGVVERLGLGYDVLKAINPRIVLLSSSGLGHTGPAREDVAYGTLLQCFTGWSSQTGYEGGEPLIGGAWSDPMTGMLQSFLLTAAMRHARRTGEGAYIDFSMAEAMCNVLPEALMEFAMNGRVFAPMGNRDRRWGPHNLYRCAGDDAWVAIAVRDEREWRALCGAIGAADLAADPTLASVERRRAGQDAIDARISAWTRGLTPLEATSRLQAAGVPAGPSLNAADLVQDAHLLARGFVRPSPSPGGGTIPLPTLPWRFEGGPEPRLEAAPDLGVHNAEVLGRLLGLKPEEVEELEREQVLY